MVNVDKSEALGSNHANVHNSLDARGPETKKKKKKKEKRGPDTQNKGRARNHIHMRMLDTGPTAPGKAASRAFLVDMVSGGPPWSMPESLGAAPVMMTTRNTDDICDQSTCHQNAKEKQNDGHRSRNNKLESC